MNGPSNLLIQSSYSDTTIQNPNPNPNSPILISSTMVKLKPPSPRTITFLFSSHSSLSPSSFLSLKFSHFSSSPYPHHSSSSSHSPSRRYEEESRNVRVSVWWDFENCNLPAGVNVYKVAHSITAAVRSNGIKGPIQITAFGDIFQLSRSNQEALSSTGVNLTHIPTGGKNSADRSLLVDLMYWVSQNPPPAHLFLISGDRDFASTLHRLRMNNYNILLASTDTAPSVLCSAASIMWYWNALVRGENLSGKYFNQPPDGPYGSWYGHYKTPLEDPFAETAQPACLRDEESCRPSSDVKLRSIPKEVMKQIRHILNSWPKGISITDLRSELSKSNVGVDKDLYGYKNFSRFLLSMPHILKLQSRNDGQFLVRGVTLKVPESVQSDLGISAVPASNNGNQNDTINPKAKGEDSSTAKPVNGKSPSPAVKVERPPTKVHEPAPLPNVTAEITNAPPNEDQTTPMENLDSANEVGFFRKIWRKWFRSTDGGSGRKIEEERSYSGDSSEKTKPEEKNVKSTRQSADPLDPPSLSSPSNDVVLEGKTARTSEACGNISRTTPGVFSHILNWFKIQSPNSDTSNVQCSERLNPINGHFGEHEIFSKDSFWIDMESFIQTPKGSGVVFQSKTRLQMAQNLQKIGPLVLRSLGENDLLLLVDLLISEKKWVEECPSQTFPFKLIHLTRKDSRLADPHGSNGLRSIFLSPASVPDLQKLPEHERERRFQNLPHTGVSRTVISQKQLDKPRNEILADCQKLVDEILKEHPDGFNMGTFRKLFMERYGYCLDIQKLGYQKLASLLLTLPGVNIESTHIVPSGKASKGSSPEIAITDTLENADGSVSSSVSELSDAVRKSEFYGSPWEELGPIENSTSNRNEIKSGLSGKAKAKKVGEVHHEYEPSLSDDDLSDSDGELTSSSKSHGQEKPRTNEEDSSLLQILDSWYSSKDDSIRKDGSENVDGMVDCSKNAVKQSGSSGVGIKTEAMPVNYVRKQKLQKSYTFVSDLGEDKDKLIDGILGSLKKSGETRLQS